MRERAPSQSHRVLVSESVAGQLPSLLDQGRKSQIVGQAEHWGARQRRLTTSQLREL
jgi:hypothetical protein